MFGFGKGKHEGDAKSGDKSKKDEGKGGKRIFGVPLEVLTLVEAKCFDNDVLYVPVVVRDTIEWLRRQQGAIPPSSTFDRPLPLLLAPSRSNRGGYLSSARQSSRD